MNQVKFMREFARDLKWLQRRDELNRQHETACKAAAALPLARHFISQLLIIERLVHRKGWRVKHAWPAMISGATDDAVDLAGIAVGLRQEIRGAGGDVCLGGYPFSDEFEEAEIILESLSHGLHRAIAADPRFAEAELSSRPHDQTQPMCLSLAVIDPELFSAANDLFVAAKRSGGGSSLPAPAPAPHPAPAWLPTPRPR
jgi:hypothetical protein